MIYLKLGNYIWFDPIIVGTQKMSESERFAHMLDKSIGFVITCSELRLCEAA